MNMEGRFLNFDDFGNGIAICTAVNFHVSEIAFFISEENYFNVFIFFGEPKIRFKHGAESASARDWLYPTTNGSFKTVATTVTEFTECGMSKLGAKLFRRRELALRINELFPELSAFGIVWHVLSNDESNRTPRGADGGNLKAGVRRSG